MSIFSHPSVGTSRRAFIAGTASIMGAGLLRAAGPWNRAEARISGLSLAAYSLRSEMRWMKGKPGKGDLDLFGFLDYCASLGIDGAELTAYFFPEPLDTSYCHRIKRHAQILGLDLTGGAIGNNFSHPPGSETAKQQLAYARSWIDHYAEMGIPVIRVFAGNPPKSMSTEDAIANVVANLSEALAHAEKRGILLGLENHDFTMNIDRFETVMTQIDSEWLGATFDTGNTESDKDPYEQLERVAPYALTAQVKTHIRTPEGKVAPDYQRIIEILGRHHYRGYVVLEYESEEAPRQNIPKHLHALRFAIA